MLTSTETEKLIKENQDLSEFLSTCFNAWFYIPDTANKDDTFFYSRIKSKKEQVTSYYDNVDQSMQDFVEDLVFARNCLLEDWIDYRTEQIRDQNQQIMQQNRELAAAIQRVNDMIALIDSWEIDESNEQLISFRTHIINKLNQFIKANSPYETLKLPTDWRLDRETECNTLMSSIDYFVESRSIKAQELDNFTHIASEILKFTKMHKS